MDNSLDVIVQIDILENSMTTKYPRLTKIEVWVKCNIDKCHFRVTNIISVFEMPNIHKTIVRDDSGYKKGGDYKYFNITKESNPPKTRNELFLTYPGLLRLLIVSRNVRCTHFTSWGCEILFIHQFGTLNQRSSLAG